MERPRHVSLHSPESSDLRSGIPQRGAFSAQMLQPQLASPRSSAAPSSISSRQSQYEYPPDRRSSESTRSRGGRQDHPPPAPVRQKRPSAMPVFSISRLSPSQPPPVTNPSPKRGSQAQSKVNTTSGSRVKDERPNVDMDQISDDIRDSGRLATAPTPSVHPIDTLAKKLRQQALELTKVYEELEQKNQSMQDQHQQIQELQFQLEKLQSAKKAGILVPAAAGDRSSHKTALAAAGKRSQSAVGGAGSTHQSKSKPAVSKKVEELQKHIEQLEQDKKQHEVSIKRIEQALLELQTYQKRRRQGFKSADAGKSTDGYSTDEDGDNTKTNMTPEMFHEQQLYVRVLEEAVHLKASEFRITGHEELLMVLAELRHTIYQQEQDVAEKQKQIDALLVQVQQESEQRLELRQQLDEKSTQRELEIHTFRQEKANLVGQLDRAERQLRKEQERSSHLESCIKETEEKRAQAHEKLSCTAQLKSSAESKIEHLTRSLQDMKAKLADMTAKYDQELHHSAALQESVRAKQSQIDELKILQDELLANIDRYSRKATQARHTKDQLQQELSDVVAREQIKTKEFQEMVASKENELRHLSKSLHSMQYEIETMGAQAHKANEEKRQLETRIADESKQKDEALEVNALLRAESKLAISESEKEREAMETSMREMDTAMKMSLAILVQSSTDELQRGNGTRNAENISDSSSNKDEEDMDPTLHGLRLMVRSLLSLVSADWVHQPRAYTYHLTFKALMQQLHQGMTHSLEVLEVLHASWSRERLDLQIACQGLEATAQLCKEQMQTLQQTTLKLQAQRAEDALKLEVNKSELESMKQLLAENERMATALRSLEQQVLVQNRTASHQQLQLAELSSELELCHASYRNQETELESRAQQIDELRRHLQDMDERIRYLSDLEQALDDAVSLTEQQNRSNEEVTMWYLHLRGWMLDADISVVCVQLTLRLSDLEILNKEQEEQLQSMQTREHAFSGRFCDLFCQYVDHLRASSSRVYVGKVIDHSDYDARMALYDQEHQRGDVVRMLQIFPTLLEDVVASSEAAHTMNSDKSSASQSKMQYHHGMHDHANHITPSSFNAPQQSPLKSRSQSFHVQFETDTLQYNDTRRRGHGIRYNAPPAATPSKLTTMAMRNVDQETSNVRISQHPTRPHRPGAVSRARPQDAHHATSLPSSSAATKRGEDAGFHEQLELIHDAFQTYRAAMLS